MLTKAVKNGRQGDWDLVMRQSCLIKVGGGVMSTEGLGVEEIGGGKKSQESKWVSVVSIIIY
jgi:hypothetical protein